MKIRARVLAALAMASGGCIVDNHASIEFFAVCSPPAPDTSNGACLYPASCETVALGTFTADVSFVTEAVAPIELRNQLPNNADLSIGRVNTNDAFIQRWLVGLGGLEFVVNANTTVPAAGSTVALVPLLPAAAVSLLAGSGGQVVASVRAAGRYADDRTFETGPYEVPVDFCTGCYVPPICTTAVIACPQEGQSGFYDCLQ